MNNTTQEKLTLAIDKTTIEVNTEKFADSKGSTLAVRAKHDKRYNIRVKNEDLALLDSLAESMNIPRSLLLNGLIHDILLDELNSVEELDVKMLLAQTADNLACYSNMAVPWTYDVLGSACDALSRNINRYNTMSLDVQPPHHPEEMKENYFNSQAYIAIKNVLKGIEK